MWHDGDARRKRLRQLKRKARAIGGSWMSVRRSLPVSREIPDDPALDTTINPPRKA
jgi:hypothetical protein